jgi:hypothetical protein
MLASPPPLPHQPGSLQRRLHPRVAKVHGVFFHQLLVKVTHIEIEVPLAVQPQYRLDRLQGNPFPAWSSLAPVVQPVVAVLLVAFPPPPHGPVRHADDCAPRAQRAEEGPMCVTA